MGWGCANNGSSHSESFYISNHPSRTKHSISLICFSSGTFSNIYGLTHTGFESYFNLKYNGSVFQVPSVQSNNSSIFFYDLSNSLHFVSVKCWHWFYITVFKSTFSYLASKSTRNYLVEILTSSDSCTYSA